MNGRAFVGMGLLWGVGMFAFALYDRWGQLRPSMIAILAGLSLCGGILFGVVMWLGTIVLAKHSGLKLTEKRSPLRARKKVAHFISIGISAALIGFALLFQFEFFWAAAAAGLGPTLVLLPLSSQAFDLQRVVLRAMGSLFVGTCSAVAVGLLSFYFNSQLIFVSFAYALGWTTAQLVALSAKPPAASGDQ